MGNSVPTSCSDTASFYKTVTTEIAVSSASDCVMPSAASCMRCGIDGNLGVNNMFGKPQVPKSTAYWNSQLIQAAHRGDSKMLQEAVDNGATVNTRRGLVLRMGHPEDQPDAKRQDRKARKSRSSCLTPLMYAAVGGHLTCVMLLLDAKADATEKDVDGMTAMHFAAQAGSLDAAKALMLAGSCPGKLDDNGLGLLDHLPLEVTSLPPELARWKALAHGGDVFM
eukprot:TRINITY_DN26565_c0_g1_i1.p1 TRINITY_DN26565_c0_g1~~TRINITY_DN26565_c0_g1_i1.p1  ORF type:complete len:224 (-),score=50.49 TRINITY_DN26565_c0_g1_i1:285-956(-)